MSYISVFALAVNAIICAIFAETADAFLVSNAVLVAAMILSATGGDAHGD